MDLLICLASGTKTAQPAQQVDEITTVTLSRSNSAITTTRALPTHVLCLHIFSRAKILQINSYLDFIASIIIGLIDFYHYFRPACHVKMQSKQPTATPTIGLVVTVDLGRTSQNEQSMLTLCTGRGFTVVATYLHHLANWSSAVWQLYLQFTALMLGLCAFA